MSDTYFRIPDFDSAVAWLKRDYTYLKVFFGAAFIATGVAVHHNPKALVLLFVMSMLAVWFMHISLGVKLKGYGESDE